MEWFPVVAVTFKVLVLGIGMFFAIKWHYDQGKKKAGKEAEKRALLRSAAKVAVVFVLALVVLVFVTFALGKKLGMDLAFP